MKCLKIPIDKVSVVRKCFFDRSFAYDKGTQSARSAAKRRTYQELAEFFRDLADSLEGARGYPTRAKGDDL